MFGGFGPTIVGAITCYVSIYDKLDDGFKYSVALVYGGVAIFAILGGVACGAMPVDKSKPDSFAALGVFSLLVGAVYYLFFLEL